MTLRLLRGGTVVTAQAMIDADLLLAEGTIMRILPRGEEHSISVDASVDVSGRLIFPGLIDCHVHFREPGLTQKGDMYSESRSALAGGVTTVCEMPNTIPPTTSIDALADKVKRAAVIADCDLRFYFGVTEQLHLTALRELWEARSGECVALKQRCCGVKLYFDHSTGNQKVDGGIIDDIFHTCAQHDIPLVCHCEDPTMNANAARQYESATDIAVHSRMRPAESEAQAIVDAIAFARKHGAAMHVAHLSTRQGVDCVRAAKVEGLRITCEVAPHHLFLSEDDYPRLGALGKMNPPLRSKEHVAALWEGIRDGTVDCIATDHAPHTMEEKRASNPLKAPSGVPGVETMLPLLLSVAGRLLSGSEGFSYADIVRLCFDNPNRIFNLGKQGIREGAPADLVIVDPAATWTIHGAALHAKCGWTPFEGWNVRGRADVWRMEE